MSKILNLGIIGHGFVGKAVGHAFSINTHKFIIDPKYSQKTISQYDVNFDVIFICVPTPMGNHGEVDESILQSVIEEIKLLKCSPLVVLKSTVTPDIANNLFETIFKFVYNPEFLTEKNYIDDFISPSMQIFGGRMQNSDLLEAIYKNYSICSECKTFKTTVATASLVKYAINSFLATKVIFLNQLYDIWKNTDHIGSWDKFMEILSQDERIGSSHMKVPGNDGRRGFGGSCFPKDLAALAVYANDIDVPFTLIEEVIDTNRRLRNE